MTEGMAEAVVSVFQHAAMTPDIAHLATKADLEALKAEMATKADLLELEVRMMERIRQQGWATLGGMTVLLAVSMAIGKLIA